MPSAFIRFCWVALSAGAAARLSAQTLGGLNASVAVAGVHDSYVGWYNVATPVLTYAFSPRYSGDLSMSIYPYRLAPDTYSTTGKPLIFTGGDLGDLLLEAHATFEPGAWRDVATAAITMPTGNRADGLGTGRVTFNVDNRLERYVGRTGFLVDVGGGDSSGLQNRLVIEDDASLGPLAQFQIGIVTWLTRGISLQSVAYEQLPIGDQKTYTTVIGPRGNPLVLASGRKVNEDNGFTTSLYVPLNSHTMLTSSYNRSLRLHLDTVSVGLTFTWKKSAQAQRESLIDRAMREAETGVPVVRPPH